VKTEDNCYKGYKIIQVNDSDWFLSKSIEDAKADASKLFGFKGEELEEYLDEPRETTWQELDKFILHHDEPVEEKMTFREGLIRYVNEGHVGSMFASTVTVDPL
jgi:hypothetical protein